MKNKPQDLVNHLFAQIERLGNEELDGEGIQTEAARSRAMTEAADQIISVWRSQIEAAKLVANHGDRFKAGLTLIDEEKMP